MYEVWGRSVNTTVGMGVCGLRGGGCGVGVCMQGWKYVYVCECSEWGVGGVGVCGV